MMRRNWVAALTVLFVAPLSNAQTVAKPALLEEAEAARRQPEKGFLRYRLERMDAGKVTRTLFYQFEFSGDQRLLVHLGDENGIVLIENPDAPTARSKVRQLQLAEGGFTYIENNPYAGRGGFPGERVIDVRAWGLSPLWAVDPLNLEDYVVFEASSYEIEKIAGYTVVSALGPDSKRQEWWFRDGEEPGPCRVIYKIGENEVAECVTDYQVQDGFLFPVKSEFFNEGQLVKRIRMEQAEFNRPEQASLGFGSLQMRAGTVMLMGGEDKASQVWNGAEIVHWSEYVRSLP